MFSAFAVFLLASLSIAQSPLPMARLIYVGGKASIASTSKISNATAGAGMQAGNSIATHNDSTAILELRDGSRLKLRANSKITLDEPMPGSNADRIELVLGSVFVKTVQGSSKTVDVTSIGMTTSGHNSQFFVAFGCQVGKGSEKWFGVNYGNITVADVGSKFVVHIPRREGLLLGRNSDLKPRQYNWMKALNWNMYPERGAVMDSTPFDAAYLTYCSRTTKP